jgi:hypothetical protein
MQFGQEPLEFRWIGLPGSGALQAHWLAANCPILSNQVFYIPVFYHEPEDVLPRSFGEFGTQVDIMPEIINPRDQAFQNERGFVAGQN